jgi:integrase
MSFDTSDMEERSPLSDENYRFVLNKAIADGDQRRTLIATLAVTGCRLSEVSGLQVKDVNVKEKSISIKPNALRRLKNKSSERVMPIVDDRVWKLILKFHQKGKPEDPLFDELAGNAKSNSVSATAVKWIKKHSGDAKAVAHSLRHTVTQKLKDTGEINDGVMKSIIWGDEINHGLG